MRLKDKLSWKVKNSELLNKKRVLKVEIFEIEKEMDK